MNEAESDQADCSHRSSIFRWDADAFTQKILSITGFAQSHFIIDVGCGDGSFREGLAKRSGFYVGIDVKLDKNWKRCRDANCQFVVCDARHLPFVDWAFDDALSKDVLHHTHHPKTVLLETMRVASRRIVVLESNRYNPIMFVHMTALLRHAHFKQADFESLIRSVDPAAVFSTAEAHVLPRRPPYLAPVLKSLFNCVERSRLRSIHSYNIAFANRLSGIMNRQC
jgi:ubiquinone/menaquinone biosynthesis C-methylase UbiE